MRRKVQYLSLFNLIIALLMWACFAWYFLQSSTFSSALAASLTLLLFLALGIREWIYEKILSKEPKLKRSELKKFGIYRVTAIILNITEILVFIGVWIIRLKL